MAIDIKRTWFDHINATALATGASVSEEGAGLVSVLEGGVEKVQPSTALAGQVFAGFARFRQLSYATNTLVVEGVVPASAAYSINVGKTNLVSGQVRVYDVTSAADLVIVAAAPAAGEVWVKHASGELEFNSAEASDSVTVYFRYNMTVQEAQLLYYDHPTNYPDANLFAQVGVGKGKGQMFTLFYDAKDDFSASNAVKLGAGGMLTLTGSGPAVPGVRVIQVPSAEDPHLGIEFNC